MKVYLNEIEMGDGIYGIEAASETYYHKSASRLTLHEAIALASVLPAPLHWKPTDQTPALLLRQKLIATTMYNNAWP